MKEIEYKFIDRDGDIWDLERKIIPNKNREIVYWSASTKNKRKKGMRNFKYETLINKLNKHYGTHFSVWHIFKKNRENSLLFS